MNELLYRENVMRYLRIDDEHEGDLAMTFVAAAMERARAHQKRDWEDGMPQYVQIACLMMAAQWWEHRDGMAPLGGGALPLPDGIAALLDIDRFRQVGSV